MVFRVSRTTMPWLATSIVSQTAETPEAAAQAVLVIRVTPAESGLSTVTTKARDRS